VYYDSNDNIHLGMFKLEASRVPCPYFFFISVLVLAHNLIQPFDLGSCIESDAYLY
jgi:hypothetical protein